MFSIRKKGKELYVYVHASNPNPTYGVLLPPEVTGPCGRFGRVVRMEPVLAWRAFALRLLSAGGRVARVRRRRLRARRWTISGTTPLRRRRGVNARWE